MISSLEDAWRWYECVRALARDMRRLGERFWDREEWAQPLSRDNRFRFVEAGDLRGNAATILQGLDDLGVLLMFSVFEAVVRDQARTDVENSLPERLHPAVKDAVKELQEDIKSGSFGRVTERFKSMDINLVELVNQVRIYRNWVAHGRRNERPASVTPREAYDRLNRFLQRMAEVMAISAEGSDRS